MAFDPGIGGALLVMAVGPVTSLGEAAATSIAAGMLLGGFMAGIYGTAAGWESRWRDDLAVGGGYVGGLVTAVVLVGEALFELGWHICI